MSSIHSTKQGKNKQKFVDVNMEAENKSYRLGKKEKKV